MFSEGGNMNSILTSFNVCWLVVYLFFCASKVGGKSTKLYNTKYLALARNKKMPNIMIMEHCNFLINIWNVQIGSETWSTRPVQENHLHRNMGTKSQIIMQNPTFPIVKHSTSDGHKFGHPQSATTLDYYSVTTVGWWWSPTTHNTMASWTRFDMSPSD